VPEGLKLRKAGQRDLPYLSELAFHSSVEPFLAPGARDRLPSLVELRADDEGVQGMYVIQLEREPVGGLALQLVSEHSRICSLSGLMVNPEMRHGGIGSAAVRLACRLAFNEHGLHRVQAEVYGDNVASQRLFESVGFIREGIRRRAYWRREQWLDGVLYGILADEFRDG
jgi:RimJ/RimL family protein N-acetyltransferase